MDVPTLFDELATIPDPRRRHGQRHPLSAILGMVALAMLMGRTRLAGIARFGRLVRAVPRRPRRERRRDRPRPVSGRPPRPGRRRARVPRRQDVARLPRRRRARRPSGGRFCPRAQAVLAQVRVDAKTSEHKAALELLGILPVSGKVVVGDALFCQRDLAGKVVDSGGDDLLAVKDNQEALKVDIRAHSPSRTSPDPSRRPLPPADLLPPERIATAVDKGHVRVEVRTLRTTSVLTSGSTWPGLRQGIELRRERRMKGKVEVSYAITSRTRRERSACWRSCGTTG